MSSMNSKAESENPTKGRTDAYREFKKNFEEKLKTHMVPDENGTMRNMTLGERSKLAAVAWKKLKEKNDPRVEEFQKLANEINLERGIVPSKAKEKKASSSKKKTKPTKQKVEEEEEDDDEEEDEADEEDKNSIMSDIEPVKKKEGGSSSSKKKNKQASKQVESEEKRKPTKTQESTPNKRAKTSNEEDMVMRALENLPATKKDLKEEFESMYRAMQEISRNPKGFRLLSKSDSNLFVFQRIRLTSQDPLSQL